MAQYQLDESTSVEIFNPVLTYIIIWMQTISTSVEIFNPVLTTLHNVPDIIYISRNFQSGFDLLANTHGEISTSVEIFNPVLTKTCVQRTAYLHQ